MTDNHCRIRVRIEMVYGKDEDAFVADLVSTVRSAEVEEGRELGRLLAQAVESATAASDIYSPCTVIASMCESLSERLYPKSPESVFARLGAAYRNWDGDEDFAFPGEDATP